MVVNSYRIFEATRFIVVSRCGHGAIMVWIDEDNAIRPFVPSAGDETMAEGKAQMRKCAAAMFQ